MPEETIKLPGYQVGDLFAQVVTDVRRTVPPGMTGAIDVHVEFSSLNVTEKGLSIIWTNKKSSESSMSIKLATRVYTDGPMISQKVIVTCMQKSLAEDGHYHGPVDGQISPAVDAAIDAALAASNDADLSNLQGLDTARRRLGYLQFALNKLLVTRIDVDGQDGPQTQRALFLLFGDYQQTLDRQSR